MNKPKVEILSATGRPLVRKTKDGRWQEAPPAPARPKLKLLVNGITIAEIETRELQQPEHPRNTK